jgi:hypothetical protein
MSDRVEVLPSSEDSEIDPAIAAFLNEEEEVEPRRGRRRQRFEYEEEEEHGNEYEEEHDPARDIFGDDMGVMDEDDDEEDDMSLPLLDHVFSDVYRERFMAVVCAMGDTTTELLRDILVEKRRVPVETMEKCKQWIFNWTGYLVEHYDQEIDDNRNTLGTIIELPTGINGKMQSECLAIHALVEIWRLKLIVAHSRLHTLVYWKICTSEFLMGWMEEDIPDRKLLETPVIYYRQSQILAILEYLVTKINIIPLHEDYQQLFEIIELKNAMWYGQSMPQSFLDAKGFFGLVERNRGEDPQDWEGPDDTVGRQSPNAFINRNYVIYCMCYLTPFMRRFYYPQIFTFHRMEHEPLHYLPDGAVDRLKKWMHVLAKRQESSFYERYLDICQEGYLYPGDTEWSKFLNKGGELTAVEIIKMLRGKGANDLYVAETGFTWQLVLAGVNRRYSSNLYVINLFDRWMNTFKDIPWADGYVIMNEDISEPDVFEKWATSPDPLLMQVCSTFWVIVNGDAIKCDDIYVSICMWLDLVRRTRQRDGNPAKFDCLSITGTYIGDLIEGIFYGRGDRFEDLDIQEQAIVVRRRETITDRI